MNPNLKNDINLSKALSWLLRHAAVNEGLQINDKGFIKLDDILKHPKFACQCSISDVLRVVEQNDKQRFSLQLDSDENWWIKANQGHTIAVENLELDEIKLSPTIDVEYPEIIHGTYFKSWQKIKGNGLHRMRRNHIHFACGLPQNQAVISGMRHSCQVYIYINLKRALQDQLKFYKSANGVILCPGDCKGFLRPEYFSKVIDAKTVCNVAIPQESARESHNQGKRHQLALHAALTEDNDYKSSVFSVGWPNAIKKEEILNFMATFGAVKSNFIAPKGSWMITTYENPKIAQDLIEQGKTKFYGRKIQFSAKKRAEATPQPPPQAEPDFQPLLKTIYNQKSFGDEILTLCNILQPNPEEEIKKYLHLCADLENAMQCLYGGAKVHPFGSTITGLSFRDSDVDAYIKVPNPPTYRNKIFYVEAVMRTKDLLFHNRLFTNIVSIPRAKTPIIRCVHVPTGVKCDFNFKNMLGVCNSYYIQFVVGLDNKLKLCSLVLKFWAKYRLLCGNSSRLSNYALTMMFIYYLQQEPYKLPSIIKLQENPTVRNIQYGWNGGFDRNYPINLSAIRNASLIELLHGFFKFYAGFDYQSLVISPYLGTSIDKSCFANIDVLPAEFQQYRLSYRDEHLKVDAEMCVQDPFEHNRNLVGAVSKKFKEEFVDELKRALGVFEEQQPHMLYNICVDNYDNVKKYEIRAKMPRLKWLQFLLPEISTDDSQPSFALKLAWFHFVDEFLIDLLTDVFKFALNITNDSDSHENPKKMKQDFMTNLHEYLQISASGMYNLWDARNVVKDVTFPPEFSTFMARQGVISKYIQEHLLRDVTPKKPIINLKFNVAHYIVDTHIVINLEAAEGDEEMEENGHFSAFASMFSKEFVSWLVLFTKEKNKPFMNGYDAAKESIEEQKI